MSESRAHKLGRKEAENILETSNLFYNRRTRANYLRGVVRGLATDDWIKEIIKQELKGGE